MAKSERIRLSIILLICLAGVSRADLTSEIANIINRPSQKKVRFGIHVISAESGRTVYRHNSQEVLIPASNMKLIITAAALRYLGPDFVYRTRIGLCGNTLVVVGSGDPLLGDPVTDAKYGRKGGWLPGDITAALRRCGVTAIEDIIVDTSIFDDERVHPNWPRDELNRWYASEVSGLNYNGNCVDVTTRNVKGRAEVIVEPRTAFIKIINEVKAVTSGKSAVGSYRNSRLNEITVFGTCKNQQGPFRVAIERPAGFFGYLLAEQLIREGIEVQGQLYEKAVGSGGEFRVVAEYGTAVSDCLARCNKDSLQLAAESLLKTIAAVSEPAGKNGSWAKARELVGEYLLSLGINKGQFYIDDGSGLSRFNRLSANVITTVLLSIYNSDNWPLYEGSLAVGGVEGTLADYFGQPAYKGKILGKTGYIDGVKSFSGICHNARGDYLFSILANGANGRTRGSINDIAKAIMDSASE